MSLQGEILIRERTGDGRRESRHAFDTLDELYTLGLSIHAPRRIEGLILHGQDDTGQMRSLAFEFRSITSVHSR